MSENTQLRFYLADKLMKMPYGHNLIVPRKDVMEAWPPTGDHDRSNEGFFHALALAAGGNRPEESYTTEERIERDLDDSFQFQQRAETGDWHFQRMLSCCPKCRGLGYYQDRKPSTETPYFIPSKTIEDSFVTVENVNCDHRPTV